MAGWQPAPVQPPVPPLPHADRVAHAGGGGAAAAVLVPRLPTRHTGSDPFWRVPGMRRRDADGVGDRARGALLGLAVGDALGAPLEWLHPTRSPASAASCATWCSTHWARGEWTDDTAMAIELATSLVEMRRLRRGRRVRPVRDVGPIGSPGHRRHRLGGGTRSRSANEARAAATGYHQSTPAVRAPATGRSCAPCRSRFATAATRASSSGVAARLRPDPSPSPGRGRLRLVQPDGGGAPRDRRPPRRLRRSDGGGGRDRRPTPSRSGAEVQEQVGYVVPALRVGFAGAFGHDVRAGGCVRRQPGRGRGHQCGGRRSSRRRALRRRWDPERWIEPCTSARRSGLATRLLRA